MLCTKASARENLVLRVCFGRLPLNPAALLCTPFLGAAVSIFRSGLFVAPGEGADEERARKAGARLVSHHTDAFFCVWETLRDRVALLDVAGAPGNLARANVLELLCRAVVRWCGVRRWRFT